MNQTIMKNILSILVVLLLWNIGNAQTSTTSVEITKEKKAAIDKYLDYLEAENQIIGAISIAREGKEVYGRNFGQQNLTDKTIDANELVYQIGSITKLFTAVLIGQLVEKNKLSYDELLSDYFPTIPNASKITINQMLNHTSGLKDFITKDDTLPEWLFEPVLGEEIMEEIIKSGVAFEPGEGLQYSNGAYYLLTKIVEQKYRKPYKKIVTERIFKPLKLSKTNSISIKDNYQNIAKPYEKLEEWTVVKDFYFPNVIGVGDIVSTPQELNRFIYDLFSYKIIKKATLEEMLPLKGEPFGYGIMGIPFYGKKLYGHGGDTRGTHCVMAYDRPEKLSISYMINGELFLTNDFALGLLSIIYDRAYEYPKFDVYKVSSADLLTYEGIYGASDFPMELTIYKDGSQLKAKGTGQPAFILKAVDKHQFAFEKAGLEITFVPKNQSLILKQGGQTIELDKE
jgi:D-alanyl-D-alanine carboxypeptidase